MNIHISKEGNQDRIFFCEMSTYTYFTVTQYYPRNFLHRPIGKCGLLAYQHDIPWHLWGTKIPFDMES